MSVDTIHAEQILIEHAYPGQWVRTWGDDGSASWAEIFYVAHFTHTESGRRATEVRAADGEEVVARP